MALSRTSSQFLAVPARLRARRVLAALARQRNRELVLARRAIARHGTPLRAAAGAQWFDPLPYPFEFRQG